MLLLLVWSLQINIQAFHWSVLSVRPGSRLWQENESNYTYNDAWYDLFVKRKEW